MGNKNRSLFHTVFNKIPAQTLAGIDSRLSVCVYHSKKPHINNTQLCCLFFPELPVKDLCTT
jgi:hypothetical protein